MWQGTLTTRLYRGDFSASDLLALYQRHARPARAPTASGIPLFYLDEETVARIEADLDLFAEARYAHHNAACNGGRTTLLNLLAGTAVTGIQYFAVGTGAGTPSATDTQLFTEFFRKVPTSNVISGGSIVITTLFGTTEGNATYTEAGLFGNGATSTANSGTLFAHAGYTFIKTSSSTLTNTYTITLT